MADIGVKIPGFVRALYPRRIWKGPAEGKSLYLTFDDGPIPEVTPWVLAQLKSFGAKASFFCIGENVEKHPEIFNEIMTEGHSVGNHTYNHLNGWKTTKDRYVQNTLRTQQVMEDIAPESQVEKQLFRPPYGRIKNSQARELVSRGFRIVMWHIVSRDYSEKVSAESCLQNVLRNTVPGSVIVFHDSLKAEPNMKFVLPRVLEHFSKLGYNFKSL